MRSGREFLKLYFPLYQRGLRLKKPMVPPQSLTLVSSNTSRLLPTCSYSSIQPFSHQFPWCTVLRQPLCLQQQHLPQVFPSLQQPQPTRYP
ncbi:hypothetical protein AV530_001673 [Patagioenas fasciata monilis]|uniref:Uncharacterized protein n=1 Tax=Patagioenas fasciata monilis TaxID=372326 RepID=A0A1V4KLX0_PATFA|nr:hypothetical protein AV530_001673 [Patagioenas fasciata monilis]